MKERFKVQSAPDICVRQSPAWPGGLPEQFDHWKTGYSRSTSH